MNFATGLLFGTLAGILQGTFILPMTYARNWEWAHKGFAFSVLGMFLLNRCIAFCLIDNLTGIIAQIPSDLMVIDNLKIKYLMNILSLKI